MLDKPGGRLAGKSTLNRLEHADKIGQDRHHKFDHDGAAIERLFVDVFLDAFSEPPIRIEIDLDATDDPLYGQQEGRHFNGYYDCYCYLPLYIFCGRHLLAAKLRSVPSVGRKTSAPRTCLTPLNTSPALSPVNASRLPSRASRASLRAGVARYTFTATDFHRLPFAGHRGAFDSRPDRAIRTVVAWCVRRRGTVVALTFAVLVASAASFAFIPKQFFPNSNRPEILVDLWLPEGSSFKETENEAKRPPCLPS